MKPRTALLLITLFAFIALQPHHSFDVYASAAPSEDEQVLIMDDGSQLYYNQAALDGGICFNKSTDQYSALSHIKFSSRDERAVNPAPTVIQITFQTQINNWFCAPAAVRMVLSGIGIIETQQNIALEIGTNIYGTEFGDTLVDGMNGFVAGTAYAFILKSHNYTSADTAAMKSNLMYAINYGNPVLVNSDESDGEHIPGHAAAGIIYHYACVNGYTYGGNSFLYTDPAYGLAGMDSVIKNQFITTNMLSLALGGRGYVY